MFPPRSHIWRTRPGRAPSRAPAGTGRRPLTGAILRIGLVLAPLAAALPGGASAQALGTMQVTARVLPSRPAWAGLTEAQALAQQVLMASPAEPQTRRTGLVLARAGLASTAGQRRLLVRVDYPRN
jgi:hypothetical protein